MSASTRTTAASTTTACVRSAARSVVCARSSTRCRARRNPTGRTSRRGCVCCRSRSPTIGGRSMPAAPPARCRRSAWRANAQSRPKRGAASAPALHRSSAASSTATTPAASRRTRCERTSTAALPPLRTRTYRCARTCWKRICRPRRNAMPRAASDTRSRHVHRMAPSSISTRPTPGAGRSCIASSENWRARQPGSSRARASSKRASCSNRIQRGHSRASMRFAAGCKRYTIARSTNLTARTLRSIRRSSASK